MIFSVATAVAAAADASRPADAGVKLIALASLAATPAAVVSRAAAANQAVDAAAPAA